MQVNIIVNLDFEAVHRWEGCNIKEVEFLKYRHRHIFKIQCKKQVSHTDRDIEIICLKRDIQSYLSNKYKSRDLGNSSCEDLAIEILTNFKLDYCSVLEDGENGAEVYKEEGE